MKIITIAQLVSELCHPLQTGIEILFFCSKMLINSTLTDSFRIEKSIRFTLPPRGTGLIFLIIY